jgi:hypothetical protein
VEVKERIKEKQKGRAISRMESASAGGSTTVSVEELKEELRSALNSGPNNGRKRIKITGIRSKIIRKQGEQLEASEKTELVELLARIQRFYRKVMKNDNNSTEKSGTIQTVRLHILKTFSPSMNQTLRRQMADELMSAPPEVLKSKLSAIILAETNSRKKALYLQDLTPLLTPAEVKELKNSNRTRGVGIAETRRLSQGGSRPSLPPSHRPASEGGGGGTRKRRRTRKN